MWFVDGLRMLSFQSSQTFFHFGITRYRCFGVVCKGNNKVKLVAGTMHIQLKQAIKICQTMDWHWHWHYGLTMGRTMPEFKNKIAKK